MASKQEEEGRQLHAQRVSGSGSSQATRLDSPFSCPSPLLVGGWVLFHSYAILSMNVSSHSCQQHTFSKPEIPTGMLCCKSDPQPHVSFLSRHPVVYLTLYAGPNVQVPRKEASLCSLTHALPHEWAPQDPEEKIMQIVSQERKF